ncbi:glycosyltransferase family 4 protein [Chloroflexota bacterium]
MNILHLIYDDMRNPWLGGGGAFQTFILNKALVKRGHKVTVVTGNYPNASKEETLNGITYKRVGSSKNYFLSRITYSSSVRRSIRELDYDILVDDISAFSPTFSPLLTRKPVVAIIRSIFALYPSRKYKFLGVGAWLSKNLGVNLYQNFLANSAYMAENIREATSKKKIAVISDSVDEALFLLEGREDNFIFFLGRIDIHQKGLDTLLEAFERVREQREIDLVIGGGGKDIDKLRDMISRLGLSGSVKLEGRVHGQTKEKLFQSCKFVVMPSRFESFGDVAIEAAACAKPIIGTKIPGLWDTIRDEDTGILIKAGETKELSEAMLRLLDDKALREKLGQAGREWARNFNADESSKMFEEFYLECLNAHKG